MSQTLRDHGKKLHLIYKHPIHYYTHASFIYWRQHNTLFITLKLPLSAYDMLFDVFQIIQTPNPLHNEPSYSTSLQDIDHYLLMASNNQAYTTIPSSVSQINPPNFKSLLLRKFWHKAHTSCLTAIYYDLPLQVNRLCNFSVIPNKEDKNIIELDEHKLLLVNIIQFSLICPDSVQLKTGCKYCLYNLAPRCGISSTEISITSLIPDHGQTNTSSEI